MREISASSNRYYDAGHKPVSLSFHLLASSCYNNCTLGSYSTEFVQAIIYLFTKRIWQGGVGMSEMRVVRITVTNGMQLFSKSLEPRGLPFFPPLNPHCFHPACTQRRWLTEESPVNNMTAIHSETDVISLNTVCKMVIICQAMTAGT